MRPNSYETQTVSVDSTTKFQAITQEQIQTTTVSNINTVSDNFSLECLTTHNFYRSKHGSQNLYISEDLTIEAQKLFN